MLTTLRDASLSGESVTVRPLAKDIANLTQLQIPPELKKLDCGGNCEYYFGPDFDFGNIEVLALGRSKLTGINLRGRIRSFSSHCRMPIGIGLDLEGVSMLTLAGEEADITGVDTSRLTYIYVPFAAEMFFDGLDFSCLRELKLSAAFKGSLGARDWPALVTLRAPAKAIVDSIFPELATLEILKSHRKKAIEGSKMPKLTTLMAVDMAITVSGIAVQNLAISTESDIRGLNCAAVKKLILSGSGAFSLKAYRGLESAKVDPLIQLEGVSRKAKIVQ